MSRIRSSGHEVPVRVHTVRWMPLGVTPKWEPVEAGVVTADVLVVGGVAVESEEGEVGRVDDILFRQVDGKEFCRKKLDGVII